MVEGSSPLTRGKRKQFSVYRYGAGLIPAHAGKTLGATDPHTSARGSSPLTRGKHQSRRECCGRMGLIPAHAGKTWSRPGGSNGLKAHPRSRGENSISCLSSAKFAGSSPLTRGKHLDGGSVEITGRLIPAHAGKTPCPASSHSSRRAHPRSRGENSSEAGDEKGSTGSSPLTRGKLIADRITGKTIGLIPAHAGKTSFVFGGDAPPGAHPRSRGENLLFDNVGKDIPGSSPLTRGKHLGRHIP